MKRILPPVFFLLFCRFTLNLTDGSFRFPDQEFTAVITRNGMILPQQPRLFVDSRSDYVMIHRGEKMIFFVCWRQFSAEETWLRDAREQARLSGLWSGECLEKPAGFRMNGLQLLPEFENEEFYQASDFRWFTAEIRRDVRLPRAEKRSFDRSTLASAPFQADNPPQIHDRFGRKLNFRGWSELSPGIYLILHGNRVFLLVW